MNQTQRQRQPGSKRAHNQVQFDATAKADGTQASEVRQGNRTKTRSTAKGGGTQVMAAAFERVRQPF
ncbi:hypothetical protein [Paenibacillus sp. DMB20]|uniref:hypothetical protein n=1 Tax=Paenibacillus sp. DMB20 TaxID=1642570 RepID=UPI0006279FDD|nr:hypothetical protein [Paenibacillus sp. DMB20]KKO54131.1 hypothetical protein XI25_08670 [Paenibacillus sp. DMB20]